MHTYSQTCISPSHFSTVYIPCSAFQPARSICHATVTIHAELDIALASKGEKLRLYSLRAIIPDLVDWLEDMMISDDVHPSRHHLSRMLVCVVWCGECLLYTYSALAMCVVVVTLRTKSRRFYFAFLSIEGIREAVYRDDEVPLSSHCSCSINPCPREQCAC
jgi:hypothetical protein